MPQIVDTEKIEAELVEEVESVRSQLKKLESQIFDFEGSYLRETLAYGNAVKVNLGYWITPPGKIDQLVVHCKILKMI